MTESKTKKCEICGARKPVADFSKSYKNRCKACVAAEARMHRESARDEENRIKPRLKDGVHGKWTRPIVFKKARNIITGEVVEVTPDEVSMKCQVPVFRTVDGRFMPQYALQFEPEIDWEQRRYEIAKDIFVHRLMLPKERLALTEEADAEIAVDLADALVEILKRSKK